MKKIGNLGAMMSACCLLAALISAKHDYRSRVTHVEQTSRTESAGPAGSFEIKYQSIQTIASMK